MRSSISIVNLDSFDGDISLVWYRDDGSYIRGRTKHIAPNGKLDVANQAFFMSPGVEMSQGYLRITSHGPRIVGGLCFLSPTNEGRIFFAHFPSEARPEHINPDTLDLLKEFANNDEIVIGAQSGSQRMLDRCHRSHTVENILSAVTLARKRGYKVIVDFIFGLPGEDDKDRRESLAVMKQVARMGARIHPHIFAPLPQTAFSKAPPGSIFPDFAQALETFKSHHRIYRNHPKRSREVIFESRS